MRKPWARSPPRALCSDVGGSEGQASQRGPSPGTLRSSWSPGPGPREASVLSHRRGIELQLEVLILEDAVESRAALGATEWPVALAAAVLGEFCKESQLQRKAHTSTKACGSRESGLGNPEAPASSPRGAVLHCRQSVKIGFRPQVCYLTQK